MKKGYLIVIIVFAIYNAGFAQKSKSNKVLADSLVNQWNVRFNSDDPKSIGEILAENVSEISGETRNVSRDSVMENFIKQRMPIISELKAVNEIYSVSKDMIYTAGGYTLKVTRSKNESYIAAGNYTLVWTKQKDGKFRIEFIHIESYPKK